MPNPSDQQGLPSGTKAAERPGMLFADIKLATARSMAWRFSTERPFCGAERAGPQRKTARKTGMKRIQTMLFPDRRRRCMKSPRTRVYRRDRPVRNDGFRDSTGSKTHNTAPRRSVEIGRAHV